MPFGSRLAADGEHLVDDPAEQHTLARLRALRAAGQTQRKIAARLNAEGLTTRTGSPWRHQYVANLLRTAARSPAYPPPPSLGVMTRGVALRTLLRAGGDR